MKFLCDACKTKYQIDDDKVAGKTVRMKCRKCEHLIEIRSPGSPSTAPPPAPSQRAPASVLPPPGASAGAPKAPLRAPLKPPTPGPPRRPAPTRPLLANSAGGTGQFRAQNPLSPVTQNLVRPGLSAGADRPGVAPLKPRTPIAPQRAGGAELARPSALEEPEEVTTNGALTDALTASATALDSLTDSPAAHKWFVAIDGSPVGPISLDDVRQRTGAGKVTGESLAWREGQGDWKKAAEIPELAALFTGKAAGRPASGVQARTPFSQVGAEEPATVMEAIPEELVRAARAAMDFPPAAAPFGGGDAFAQPNSDPFAPAPFVNPQHSPFEVSAAATASGIGAGLGGGAFHTGAEPMTAAAEGNAAALPNAGFANAGPAGPSYEDPRPQHKKAPPWIPIAMIATAVAFGITAAVVLFLPKPPKPTTDTTAKPAVSAVPTGHTDEPAVPPPDPSAAPVPPEDPRVGSVGSSGKSGGGSKGTDPKPAASSGAADLKGLLGPSGPTGPSANGGGGAGGGSGSLSQQQIERTVQSYMPGVKRGCWDTSTAQSGDVRVAITIGPSGSVSNTSSQSGDPQLARCIENKVKSWKFPAPGGSQVVNVPFKFLRQ